MARPLADVTRKELVDVLERVIKRAPEVAKNLRQYIYEIFERAILHGIIAGNPTPPSRHVNKRRRTKHHAALLDDRLGEMLHEMSLDERSDPKTIVATRLTLLTASRKCESTAAKWSEFDLDAGHWIVPAERMKQRVEHWVPLSPPVVKLLKEWREIQGTGNPYLFPNRRDPNRPMAGNTLNALFSRLGFDGEGTPHGMRAGFSTHFNSISKENKDVVERCLAHVPEDEVRAAYNRYKYRAERKSMLNAWAKFLAESEKRAAKAAAARRG